MKRFICAIGGLLLFSSAPEAAQRQGVEVERNVAVKLEKHPSRLFECSRAVAKYYPAQKNEGTVEFEFRVQMNRDELRYNSYKAFRDGQNVDGVCLQENGETGVWAIVVDVSDVHGRRNVKSAEVAMAARLVAGMPTGAKVAVYSLARELTLVGASAGDNNFWMSSVGIPRQVAPGRGEQSAESVLACFPDPEGKKNGGLNSSPWNNTNLWSGLLSLVERELPKQLTGDFAHLPANIVLLSDGVDESGRAGDLEKLAKAAASAGVKIHTIAYPFKDSKSKDDLSKPELYKGYHHLSDLSRMTEGVYCATGYSRDDQGRIRLVEEDAWRHILPQGRIRLLNLSVPLDGLLGEIRENRGLSLRLNDGNNVICAFSIPSNEMARVTGAVVIRALKKRSDNLKNESPKKEEMAKKLKELGGVLQLLCSLNGVEEVLKEAEEDKGFKERLEQIISHMKAFPDLMGDASQEEFGRFLCYGGALPRSSSQAGKVTEQPAIVNVNASSASGTEAEENDREVVLDWVWWCLGGGAVALCLLGFWCVAHLMGRVSHAPEVNRHMAGAADLSGPTQPVLASLVNMGNHSQSWVVCKTPCSVGRHSHNDVSLPFSYVSGTQFFLSRNAAGQWELKDANSTNGTMVNGRKVSSCSLNSGDVIRVADLELEFKVR